MIQNFWEFVALHRTVKFSVWANAVHCYKVALGFGPVGWEKIIILFSSYQGPSYHRTALWIHLITSCQRSILIKAGAFTRGLQMIYDIVMLSNLVSLDHPIQNRIGSKIFILGISGSSSSWEVSGATSRKSCSADASVLWSQSDAPVSSLTLFMVKSMAVASCREILRNVLQVTSNCILSRIGKQLAILPISSAGKFRRQGSPTCISLTGCKCKMSSTDHCYI